jgi:hypothetical protein
LRLFYGPTLSKRAASAELSDDALAAAMEVIKGWVWDLRNTDLEKTKEVSVQGPFLSRIFGDCLGYQQAGGGFGTHHLVAELGIQQDSADAGLGFYTATLKTTRVVVELKDATTSLDKKQIGRARNETPVEQAFRYASKQDSCKWIIVSNFKEIRLYSKFRSTDYFELRRDHMQEDRGRIELTTARLKDSQEPSMLVCPHVSAEPEQPPYADAAPPSELDGGFGLGRCRENCSGRRHSACLRTARRHCSRPNLMEAASAADRLAIVGAERDAIADACLKILEEGSLTTAFPEFSPLAQAAVKALIEGHFQAAQALAVNVIESFVREWVAEKYRTVKQYAQDADPAMADPDAPFSAQRLRLETMILPLFKFYTDWFSNTGNPAPKELSRHVTVHQATPEHYMVVNAVLAIMLMTSLLKGFTEAMT